MQWTDGDYAGFSHHEPWIGLSEDSKGICAENQINDEDSIFAYFKSLVKLRKENPVIADGSIEFMYSEREDIFCYRRSLEGREMIVLCNLTADTVSGDFASHLAGMSRLMGNYPDSSVHSGGELRPYEAVVYQN